MGSISLAHKIAFLRSGAAYGTSGGIRAIETHMSWVFLTPDHVYKLKKPVRRPSLDLTSTDARRRNCVMEVALNRRLAPDIYIGVVAMTCTAAEELGLNGAGEIIDWLVKMKRLPAARFLDHFLGHSVPETGVRAAVEQLVAMYEATPAEPLSGTNYREGLRSSIEETTDALIAERYGLDARRIERIGGKLLAMLDTRPELFKARARAGRVVEAHGDLRPEHVCLTEPPRIIDCLEFNRDMRVMDTLDEVGFLALECRMAGAPEVAEKVLACYRQAANDQPDPALLSFYQSWRALIRALLAVRHLDDEDPRQPDHWRRKAADYLAHAVALAAAPE